MPLCPAELVELQDLSDGTEYVIHSVAGEPDSELPIFWNTQDGQLGQIFFKTGDPITVVRAIDRDNDAYIQLSHQGKSFSMLRSHWENWMEVTLP